MKKILSLFTLLLALPLSAQQPQQTQAAVIPLEVTLKIAEKTGFLGMGGPRSIQISLSTKNRDDVLNSVNVNYGEYIYFLVRNNGTWKLDDDFTKETLPKLAVTQGTKKFSVEFTGPILMMGEISTILVGYNKSLSLNEPFTFTYPMEEKPSSVDMKVPKEYWPGYAKIMKYSADGDASAAEKNFTAAIASYNEILRDPALKIFTEFGDVKAKRTKMFQDYFASTFEKFPAMLANRDVPLKTKITTSEDFSKMFKFFVDSTANSSVESPDTEPGVGGVIADAKKAMNRSLFVTDSLRSALEEQNTKWIRLGSTGGKIDFRYKYVIEALVNAAGSMNFEETSPASHRLVQSEEQTARLQKYNLLESYETFVRIITDRLKKRQPMFPPDFLTNLQRDSTQFSLPYYSMLKAVNDYFAGSYSTAKPEIVQVMKYSYSPDLNERMDQLRILITTIEKRIPADVLQRMNAARAAEEKGDVDKAIEAYKDAMLLSEEYSPAAFALGKLYDRTGDSYKANNFFQKAINTDSLYYSAYRYLYINYIKNASFKPMIDLLTQALSKGNDYYEIHYYLGYAYNGAGLYTEAISQYERALELNGKSIDANIQAGISYQNMKSYTKAREYFTKAITLDPENQTATENLKRLDELQKKF